MPSNAFKYVSSSSLFVRVFLKVLSFEVVMSHADLGVGFAAFN